MNREYKYITAISGSYQNRQKVWEKFITYDGYDSTQEYVLIYTTSFLWIIYQLI